MHYESKKLIPCHQILFSSLRNSYIYSIYTVMSLTVYLFHNPYLGNRVVFHFPANSVGIELCVCKTGFWLGYIVQVSPSFDPFVLSVGNVWFTHFVYQVYLINSNKKSQGGYHQLANSDIESIIVTPSISDHEIDVSKTSCLFYWIP